MRKSKVGNAVAAVRKGSKAIKNVGAPGFGQKSPRGGGNGSWARPGGAQHASGHISK